MPPSMRAVPFREADAQNVSQNTKVSDFRCARPAEPWAEYLEQWIKREEPSSDDVLAAITKHNTEVWLFTTDQGDLIGYGSLGRTRWKWPQPDGPKTELSIIPAFAVSLDFQGEPKSGSVTDRYAYRIMSFLIEKARKHQTPAIVLFVHVDNVKAIKFYKKFGFQPINSKSSDVHMKMALDLT